MINIVVAGGWALIGLAGEFDIANSTEIVSAGAQLVNQGATDLTIDLTRVTFMGAAGCNALLAAHNSTLAAGSRMVILGATVFTRRVFHITGLDQVLPLPAAPAMAEPAAADAESFDGKAMSYANDEVLRGRWSDPRRQGLTKGSVAEVLCQIARGTVSVVPGATAATIGVRANGELRTAAVSGSLAIDVDAAQYTVNEGPCLDAARDCERIRVDTLTADERFTHFAPLALEVGIQAVLAIPITVGSGSLGSLNVYSTTAFGASAEEAADIMTALAATAMITTSSSA